MKTLRLFLLPAALAAVTVLAPTAWAAQAAQDRPTVTVTLVRWPYT